MAYAVGFIIQNIRINQLVPSGNVELTIGGSKS